MRAVEPAGTAYGPVAGRDAGDGPPRAPDPAGGEPSSRAPIRGDEARRAGPSLPWLSGASAGGATGRTTRSGGRAGVTRRASSAARRSIVRPTRGPGRRRSAMMKRGGALAELDAGTETLAEFVEEWWLVYAGPNLERSTLRTYAQMWNGHALPRLGQLQLRQLTPQTIARFRAELEGAGVGNEAIRKTMSMLQGIVQRAVEWGRVPSNAVKVTRKPHKQYRPAVQAIPPSVIEVMRARLLADGRLRDATLLVVLAYAGLRPQEALALERRHVRERTLLVERAVSDGQLKVLKNRRQPRTIPLLAPLREDLADWRRASGSPVPSAPVFPAASGGFWRASDWRNWRKRIYRPVAESVGLSGARAVRPTPRLRVAADPRGPAVGRRDRRAAGTQPHRLPRHLRPRDGRGARRRARKRRGPDPPGAGVPGSTARCGRAALLRCIGRLGSEATPMPAAVRDEAMRGARSSDRAGRARTSPSCATTSAAGYILPARVVSISRLGALQTPGRQRYNLPAVAYVPRIVDGELTTRLKASGAVVIEGPKACGKTETARQQAASEVLLDVDVAAQQAAAIDPRLVLDGATPRLIDEWQIAPEVWNQSAARSTTDRTRGSSSSPGRPPQRTTSPGTRAAFGSPGFACGR